MGVAAVVAARWWRRGDRVIERLMLGYASEACPAIAGIPAAATKRSSSLIDGHGFWGCRDIAGPGHPKTGAGITPLSYPELLKPLRWRTLELCNRNLEI